MDVNSEEAQRAKDLGRAALQVGDFARAVRMLQISDRLVPSADTRQLLSSAQAALARQEYNSRGGSARPPPPAPGGADILSRLSSELDRLLTVLESHTPAAMRQLVEKYLHPTFRKPLAIVALVIVVLVVYRFILRGPRFVFGHLPGDIHLSGQNYMFSFPAISCLLFSGGMQLLQRVMNGDRLRHHHPHQD